MGWRFGTVSPVDRAMRLVASTALTALAACGDKAPPSAADACTFARDGVCDEPWVCAPGSDSTDCERACADGTLPATHLACRERAATTASTVPPENGSNGTGGRIGTWDGVVPRNPSSSRYFRVFVPERYDASRPTPLVLMMGGFTVSMYGLADYTELNRTADANGFIVAYLEAPFVDFGPPIGWVYAWSVYRQGFSSWAQDPDVLFIARVVRSLKALYNIDRTRVFATGHSRGAAMAIIAAFEIPRIVTGFCSEMGFAEVNEFTKEMASYTGRHMPAVLVHGTADPDVSISESDTIADTLTTAGWKPDEDFRFFRLENVTHQWQPQLNQQFFDFLSSRPAPLDQVEQ